MTARNLLVVQGGGPTQVLNTTLAAIVEEARARGGFGRIYGARRGISGFLRNEIVDMGKLSAAELALLPLRDAGKTGISFVPLHAVAEVEGPIPAAWTRDGAIPVGDEFFQYLKPLIGELVPGPDT
jgi:hypothetical protein